MATRVEIEGIEQVGPKGLESLPFSQILPVYAELARRGALFAIDAHAGTAIAPVVAAPTTSPSWGLYNYSIDRRMYLLDVAVTLKSGTAGLGLAMMVATAIGPQTQDASDYAGTIKSALDGSGNTPPIVLADNPTLIGGTPAWVVVENSKLNEVATDSVGGGLVAKLDGKFVAMPRGGMVALEVVGETGTTALFTPSFLVALL